MLRAFVSPMEIVKRIKRDERDILKLLECDEKDIPLAVRIAHENFTINNKMEDAILDILNSEAILLHGGGGAAFDRELPSVGYVRKILGHEHADDFRILCEEAEAFGIEYDVRENFGLANKNRIRSLIREFRDFVARN